MNIQKKLIELYSFNERLLSDDNIKKIEGFPTHAITDSGLVFNLLNGYNLRPYMTSRGYLSVKFGQKYGKVTRSVHRLVMEHFGPPMEGRRIYVNHIDGNSTNNHISNLEWVTHHENVAHSIHVLRNKPRIKLNEEKVKNIRSLYEDGYVLRVLSERFGVCVGTIYDVVKKRTWKEVV